MKFERARTSEQINERRNEILKACADLYDESGIEGVHFKSIGKLTSFSRSTIYNYYKTKEEILLDLMMEDVKAWVGDIQNMMDSQDVLSKEEYCRQMTDIFVKNERMLKLMSILYSVLEKNCSLEKLAEFKGQMIGYMAVYTSCLDKFFPDSDKRAKEDYLTTSTSFITGLYPSSNLTEKQIEAMSLANYDYKPVDFRDMCYKGLVLLVADLKYHKAI